MRIKITKVMAKEIAKRIGDRYKVSFETLTYNEYARFVSIYPEREMDDYNASTGKFATIKIIYPDNYYAYPLYLTTNELITMYKESDKTFDGFFKTLAEHIAV